MKITVIGAGNVAFHLAKAIHNSNKATLHQLYSRNALSDHFKEIQTNVVHDINLLTEADVYIICVSDTAVIPVAQTLPFKNKLVVHTTGSVSMNDLPDTNRKGVFYPLQTFSKNKQVNFNTIPLCIEAENETDLNTLTILAKAITQSVHYIDSKQRQAIHLAAVFANNFTNHLYTITKDICDEKEIPFAIFQPLLAETLNKLNYLTPFEAQTGPARRNDMPTILKHVSLLQHKPEHQDVYKLLTESIQKSYE